MGVISGNIHTMYSLSGATFSIKGQAHAFHLANKRFPFDKNAVGVGISSGLVVLAVAAIKGSSQMLEIASNIDLKKYASNPFNKKGGLKATSLLKFLLGYHLVNQDIKPAIRSIISKKEFIDYQNDINRPDVWTNIFHIGYKKDKGTYKNIAINIKSAKNYEDFLDILAAGTAAQKLVKPVCFRNMMCIEGGQLDHNAGHKFLDKYNIDNYISIYARPENWIVRPKKVYNSHTHMASSIEINEWEKSMNDEKIEKSKSKEIKNVVISYMPRLSHTYSSDKEDHENLIKGAISNMKDALEKIN